MAYIEAVGRHGAETVGVGIVGFQFGGLHCGVFLCAAAFVQNQNITELQVFNCVAGDPGNQACLAGTAVRRNNVADVYASQQPNRNAIGPSHSAAQTYE